MSELGQLLGHGVPTDTDMRRWAQARLDQARLDPPVTTATGDIIRIPSTVDRYAWGFRNKTFNCRGCPHYVSKEEAERVSPWLSKKALVGLSDGICLYGQTEKGKISPRTIYPLSENRLRSCNTMFDARMKRAEERRNGSNNT